MLRVSIILAIVLSAPRLLAVEIVLEEAIGRSWQEQMVRQEIAAERGELPRQGLAIWHGRQARPVQLTEVTVWDDGSVREATAWFRAGLEPWQVLRLRLAPSPDAPSSDLALVRGDESVELRNAFTTVRLRQGEAARHGPIAGIRLPSGIWTAGSRLEPPEGDRVTEVISEVLEQGPLRVRVQFTYTYANGGSWRCEVELRSEDRLVRIDEWYRGAGEVSWSLGGEAAPTHIAHEATDRGTMRHDPIDYGTESELHKLAGWDIWMRDVANAIGLRNETTDDYLGLVSTDADWLPNPRPQEMPLVAAADGALTLSAPLANGHRHWGLLVHSTEAFPEPAADLIRWWNRHIILPLEKVATWQLTWPGMDELAFPHTFYNADEMLTIRQKMQATPAIRDYITNLRADQPGHRSWRYFDNLSKRWPEERQAAYAAYVESYRERGGIPNGPSFIAAAYLYSGDEVFLDQLAEESQHFGGNPSSYIDYFIDSYLEDVAPFAANGRTAYMHISDGLMLRYLALEFLLGSDRLSPLERRRLLSKLAFIVYFMHEAEWQPPVHMPDGTRPQGYPQGTPNMKNVAFAGRAITACMLGNHPMLPTWIDFAMAEARPHYAWTIHESGAMIESPFYTSRDTIRYQPFWLALTRKGVDPDNAMLRRVGRAFRYLANMLTPPEPRFGDRRVYHPIGRSSPGIIDPTFMIGAEPWGSRDREHGRLMRWAYEEQGRPAPDTMGTTGGRNIGLTLLGLAQMLDYEPLEAPLRSRRFEGMGVIMRSQAGSEFESNAIFRHDPFCWDLYPTNNGAVYFYGKGAPLLPRFGGYWMRSQGQCNLMGVPFGNRILFSQGDQNAMGTTQAYGLLGDQADWMAGSTNDSHWRRELLLAKDLDRQDPVYLLVRDDVARPGAGSALHWWVMSKAVQPNGLTQPGVVPTKYKGHDAEWLSNLGDNWAMHAEEPPPKLQGQRHHFTGQTGVDVDLFIAEPREPVLTTDAVGVGPRIIYAVNPDIYEYQQLVRIEPVEPGDQQRYLTLLVPRWPGSGDPVYTTIADGNGVSIAGPQERAWLFLGGGAETLYEAEGVSFRGAAGYCRSGDHRLRLMVRDGTVASAGATLSTSGQAALVLTAERADCYTDDPQTSIELSGRWQGREVTMHPLGTPTD